MRRPTNLAMLKIMCGKRVNAEKITGDPAPSGILNWHPVT
jgi:hypothetical protein